MMRECTKKLMVAAATLALASAAKAGFVNGGFEAGNFSGWTVDHGIFTGGSPTVPNNTWGAVNPIVANYDNAALASIVNNGTDQYMGAPSSAGGPTPILGNWMARLNDANLAGGTNAVRIRQTATILNTDGPDLYINWGAVLDNPNHPAGQNPF